MNGIDRWIPRPRLKKAGGGVRLRYLSQPPNAASTPAHYRSHVLLTGGSDGYQDPDRVVLLARAGRACHALVVQTRHLA